VKSLFFRATLHRLPHHLLTKQAAKRINKHFNENGHIDGVYEGSLKARLNLQFFLRFSSSDACERVDKL
jgi:hypothetical protein